LGQDLYLRIAVELYLKRLIVGGMERVFEIGRNFRNEGISFKHNPEFTMIELYQAYADYNDIMDLFEEMISTVAEQVTGGTTVTYEDHEVQLAAPWRRVTLRDGILEGCGIDIDSAGEDAMRARLESDGHDTSNDKTWAQLVDHLLTRYLEPSLIQPTFVTDYPIELSPFARKHRDGSGGVERFECFIAGMEVANAFSELNDPADQAERFEEQARAKAAGDEHAESTDEDYIRALEYGMPPTGGLGLGIDRFMMLLSGTRSIRDVVLFPARRS
jgi:lysyl-tRNA synthetase class 2